MQIYVMSGQTWWEIFRAWSINHTWKSPSPCPAATSIFSVLKPLTVGLLLSEEDGWQLISWLGNSLRSLKSCHFFQVCTRSLVSSHIVAWFFVVPGRRRDDASPSFRDRVCVYIVMLLQARRLLRAGSRILFRCRPNGSWRGLIILFFDLILSTFVPFEKQDGVRTTGEGDWGRGRSGKFPERFARCSCKYIYIYMYKRTAGAVLCGCASLGSRFLG